MARTKLTSKDEKLSTMLQPYRFLLADTSSSGKSIRLFLSKLLIKPSQIELADNPEDADAKIRAKKPEFVIIESEILAADKDHHLMKLHAEEIAPGRPRAFILLTPKNSGVATASVAIENIDAVILKPFTFESLMDELSIVLISKINPGPFVLAVDEGRALLDGGQPEKALAQFRNARDLAKPSERVMAWYYEGAAFSAMGRQEEATRSFEEALANEPTHFRSLAGLLEIYNQNGSHAKAYETARLIADNHPVPSQMLPEFIKLSILNKRLEDVVGFYKYAEQNDADPTTMQHLAAGLVVCGLQYLRDMQVTEALDSFRKAELASKGSPRILKRILVALIAHGLDAELRTFMARAPEDVRESPDLKLAEFDRVERVAGPERTLAFALRLIREGFRDERVFATSIQLSVQIGRRQGHIDVLVSEASKFFPEKRAHFEALAHASGLRVSVAKSGT